MKQENLKKNMLWNAAGNLIFLGCQWLITVLVTKLGNFTDAGLLSLAMSVSATFQTVAMFGIRSFQVSDIENKYSDTQYVGFRIISCLAAMTGCIVFSLVSGYLGGQLLAIFLFMLFRLSENFSDVIHGIAQKNGRLDIAGKAYAIKGIGILVVYLVTYLLTKNINLSIGAMALLSWAATILYDILTVKKLSGFRLWERKLRWFPLAKETAPLCVYLFISAAMATVPKLVLERQMGEDTLGIYSSVFAPALLISSAAGYLYSPFVPTFAERYKEKSYKSFWKLFGGITLAISVFGAVALVAAHFFGELALKLLFGDKILAYTYLLIPVLIAIFASAIFTFIATLSVVIRDFLGLIVACGAALLLEAVATGKWLTHSGINATSYSYIAACVLAGVILFLRMIFVMYVKKKKGV